MPRKEFSIVTVISADGIFNEPIVRNQPISQFVIAMRAFSGDSTPTAGVSWSTLGPSAAWLIGATIVMVPLSLILLARKRS